jgi:hypothetical protein
MATACTVRREALEEEERQRKYKRKLRIEGDEDVLGRRGKV